MLRQAEDRQLGPEHIDDGIVREQHPDRVHAVLGLPLELLGRDALHRLEEDSGLIFQLDVEAAGLAGTKALRGPQDGAHDFRHGVLAPSKGCRIGWW